MNNYLITPRVEIQAAEPKDKVAFSVTELQDMVGGYITIEDVSEGHVVFDADGARNEKLYNKLATELIRRSNSEWDGFVAGNAVVCSRIRVD